MITISYGILTHNETESLAQLLALLQENLKSKDEIIVLDDFSENTETLKILEFYSSLPQVKIFQKSLQGNFSQQKNYLNKMCSQDYIFNLDADELPPLFLLENLSNILQENQNIDLFWLPRINIINNLNNLNNSFLSNNNWQINDHGWINWPDYQSRIYKNKPQIQWKNKVHETITGFQKSLYLPEDINYALYHEKTLEKQIKNNQFYNSLLGGKIIAKKILRWLIKY